MHENISLKVNVKNSDRPRTFAQKCALMLLSFLRKTNKKKPNKRFTHTFDFHVGKKQRHTVAHPAAAAKATNL